MALETVRSALAWCTVLNIVAFLWWFLWFWLGHDFMYRIQSKWFRLSVEQFDALNYAMMGAYKLAIILFNLVPYLALRIVG